MNERIVCGIDGSRSAHEAARQAAALVAPGGSIELVAVAREWGVGLTGAAVLSKQNARRALDETARALRGCGAHVEPRVVIGHAPHEVLMRESAGRDLLVVARHTRSRLGGIALGSTASQLVHCAHIPVLV